MPIEILVLITLLFGVGSLAGFLVDFFDNEEFNKSFFTVLLLSICSCIWMRVWYISRPTPISVKDYSISLVNGKQIAIIDNEVIDLTKKFGIIYPDKSVVRKTVYPRVIYGISSDSDKIEVIPFDSSTTTTSQPLSPGVGQ